MKLAAQTAEIYVRYAVTQMHAVVERLDDEQVNVAPFGPTTNSVAGLIVHTCGVGEFWLGHVGLGRPSARDRDEEFTATRTVGELHEALDVSLRQIGADIRTLDAGGASDVYAEGRQFLEERDGSDAALVVHVIEELFQHLGHMDITADALTIPKEGSDMTIETRLTALGVVLPDPFPPVGSYVSCVQSGDLLHVGGHGPVGGDVAFIGKVGTDLTLDEGRAAARQTGLSILATMQAELGTLDRVEQIVKVFGMVNVGGDFNQMPAVIDGCSDLLMEVFGDRGRHTRSAVGLAALPFDIAVEIELIARVAPA